MTSSYFPKPISGTFCPENPRKFTLDADFEYDDPEKSIKVEIPAGFTTDFNSTPRAIWAYFSPYDYLEAGLVHDWLYKAPESFTSPTYKPPLTRQQVDDLHRRILDIKGMRWTKRQAVYGILRAAGWVAWRQHRTQDVVVPPSAPTS